MKQLDDKPPALRRRTTALVTVVALGFLLVSAERGGDLLGLNPEPSRRSADVAMSRGDGALYIPASGRVIAMPGPHGGVTAHEHSRVPERLSAARSRDRMTWRNILVDDDLLWVARQLSLSADPDDWYLATLLEVICISTALPPGTTPETDDSWPATQHLRRLAGQQCGGLSGRAFLVQPPDGILKARAAGSVLAAAPLLASYNASVGITVEAAAALRQVLSDPSRTAAWIALNHDGLTATLATTAPFSSLNFDEREATYFLTLCEVSGGCDEFNLYSFQLCLYSFQWMCGTKGIRTTLAEVLSADQLARVRVATDALTRAIANGDLAALGLRVAPN